MSAHPRAQEAAAHSCSPHWPLSPLRAPSSILGDPEAAKHLSLIASLHHRRRTRGKLVRCSILDVVQAVAMRKPLAVAVIQRVVPHPLALSVIGSGRSPDRSSLAVHC
jgi:hypothetical protein